MAAVYCRQWTRLTQACHHSCLHSRRYKLSERVEPSDLEAWLLRQLDYAANKQLNNGRRRLQLEGPDGLPATLEDWPVVVQLPPLKRVR